jgi:hypothetical protein
MLSNSVDAKQPQGRAEIFNKFHGCCEGMVPVDEVLQNL